MLLYSVWKNLFHLLHMGDILAKSKNASLAVSVHFRLHMTKTVIWTMFSGMQKLGHRAAQLWTLLCNSKVLNHNCS